VLTTILDLLGIAVFAASGALVGVAKRLDFFGVCVMGVFTALGGGVVRDVLIGITPPTSLNNWPYIGVALAVSIIALMLPRHLSRMAKAITWLDALGMGLFASTGAVIALGANSGSIAACIAGGVTAIGGGVLRDILVNEVPLLLQRELYAVPALLASALVVVMVRVGFNIEYALVVGTLFASGFRILSVVRGWSLPRSKPID
jgi:uncharacterized membrane protein YeiH